MGVLLKDAQIKTQKTNKRKRKKRRTEDFSSDSSSSSSSSSESEADESEYTENSLQKGGDNIKAQQQQQQDINLNGMNFNNSNNNNNNIQQQDQQVISDETKLKLSSIKITNIPNITSLNKDELAKISTELDKQEQDLHNAFLVKMMTDYDTDLDELRVKPDFTAKSLPLLAKILKNGANIFDDESLKTIIKN